MPILTQNQERAYHSNGYLLVPGLVSAELAGEAEAAMWRLLNLDPADPATWEKVRPGHPACDDPSLRACFTLPYRAAAALLAGDKVDLGRPIELVPQRGDVLFYHYLCAHAGSRNTGDRPRFALNQKW